jgi:anthranilate phosphoribosyltransferase
LLIIKAWDPGTFHSKYLRRIIRLRLLFASEGLLFSPFDGKGHSTLIMTGVFTTFLIDQLVRLLHNFTCLEERQILVLVIE